MPDEPIQPLDQWLEQQIREHVPAGLERGSLTTIIDLYRVTTDGAMPAEAWHIMKQTLWCLAQKYRNNPGYQGDWDGSWGDAI